MNKIFFVGGGKGGVGKSTVSIALIDYLLLENHKVMLIETDTSNPDTAKIYRKMIPVTAIALDTKDGWINLISTIDANKEMGIVINSAARNRNAIEQYGKMFNMALEHFDRAFETLWTINRHRDSIDLLKDYRKSISGGRLTVLRNLYFGEADKFELFNNSDLKKTIIENDGLVLNFPDLADRITDIITSKRVGLAELAEHETLGNKIEIERFRGECRIIFDEIVDE